MIHVCVALILYGPSPHAMEVLSALKSQELDEEINISLVIIDNGISQTLRAEIFESFEGQFLLLQNNENLGFAAAANQALEEAIRYKADFLLLLNPDLLLDKNCISELVKSASHNSKITFFTPKLLKANSDLTPTQPATIDSSGICITKELRHFDRGNGFLDQGQYDSEEEIFGGSGACLLIRISEISKLIIPRSKHEKLLWKIYPQLEQGADTRPQLFDEAFFAYREDADLAWRSQIKGFSTIYCPQARGLHVRLVTPDVRASLPPQINLWGVRNRFLLQLNNLKILSLYKSFIPGVLFRNIIVILGVLLKERSSLPAFKHLWVLFPRTLEIRRFVFKNSIDYRKVARWFLDKTQ